MLFNLFASILAAMIVSNVVLSGFGVEVVASKQVRLKPALITSSIVALLSLIVFLVDYVIYTFVLVPVDMAYLNLLVVAVLAIGLNELYHFVTGKLAFELPKTPLIGVQSIVLVTTFVLSSSNSFSNAFIFALGGLLGYIGFAVLFTSIASRIRVAPMQKAFRGLPIALIILGIIVMIIGGLGGVL